ncbi:protein translocase subunit SecF [Candidatus Methanoperedens nitratireducens]|uniref:Protein-export membrane protein SecF n=1 Tax=Candidatus Methanoperedens nitratireducens TaxID=1392998 RepID=A0A284VJG0_9EURY|nr:protein translocase subunit SecF [Candidatus Methanoperedens nitroreducens]SNQ59401.1 Protein-export membrane protein SecF [Candidatus Methanoperedens nitroreducens]
MDLISEKAIEAYVKNTTLKQMLIVPAILLLLSLSILAYTTYKTGSPVELGLEFKGGTAIYLDSPKTPDQLKEDFRAFNVVQAREYGASGERKILQFGPMDSSSKDELIKKVKSEFTNVEIRDMGEQFSKTLQSQAIRAIIISFIFMAIVVFVIFKTIVPSIAVLISAFADIAFAAAMMDIFGIFLSLGTVAALLMLIGYSVDTDILLTTRLLKRKGEINDKIKDAMKTGMTMTTTTLGALIALFVVSSGFISSFLLIDIIRDISIVLIFGLIADIINTWMTNLGILRWYIERGTRRIEKRIEKPKRKGQRA